MKRGVDMKKSLAILMIIFLAGCMGQPSLEDEKLSDIELNLEDFFEGRTVAYGQFQDVFGTVRRLFKVEIEGKWDGKTLTMVEDFVYEDQSTEQRIWVLEKTGGQTWVGRADGVYDQASGEERGNAFNWNYQFDLPTESGSMKVTFNDWMWQLTEDRLLNKAYISRFGVRLGEVIIMFEKV